MKFIPYNVNALDRADSEGDQKYRNGSLKQESEAVHPQALAIGCFVLKILKCQMQDFEHI